jgi:tetratricopeptide (TPR) repeat protein
MASALWTDAHAAPVAEDALAWHARALTWEAAGSLAEAQRAFSWVVRLDTDNPDALRAVARFYERHGRVDERIRLLEIAVEKALYAPEVLTELRQAYDDAGLSERALELERRLHASRVVDTVP